MDLRDIEYFAVIAEHGHLGRAAEALGLGQPALSISLRRLERAAEARLVKRTPKGVELTAIGNALLSHVGRLRLARNDLAREMSDLAHGKAGFLRVGASPGNAESLLPEACSALLREAPRVTLTLTVQDNDALLPSLATGELDIVVIHAVHKAHAGLEQVPLREDRFVVYCRPAHPLARRSAPTLRDLAQERWVSTAAAVAGWLQPAFQERGLPPPQHALISDSVAVRNRTLASADLMGLASSRVVNTGTCSARFRILAVKDAIWTRSVAAVYRRDGYLPPAAKRFVEILKQAARDGAA